MIFIAILIGCILGAILGLNAPMISYTYSSYLAIAIIAALDSVFGGIASIIKKNFDLTPNKMIEYLDLKQPIYEKTTNYGHFGKKDLPWERIVNMEI